MMRKAGTGTTVGSTDDDVAGHMADALTYLGCVALDAGYEAVATDIFAVRDKLKSIALSEKGRRQQRANA
jgi:hypothetical protein